MGEQVEPVDGDLCLTQYPNGDRYLFSKSVPATIYLSTEEARWLRDLLTKELEGKGEVGE